MKKLIHSRNKGGFLIYIQDNTALKTRKKGDSMIFNVKKFFVFFSFITIIYPIQASIQYYGQDKQDQFINENIFHNKKNGVFVDIGAHNGITFSNTYFFEKHLDWTGVCIEPNPLVFPQLEKNRQAICYPVCISNEPGIVNFLQILSPSVNVEMLSGIVDLYDPRHLNRINSETFGPGASTKIIQIPSKTLTQVLQESNLFEIDFLSIDVEGGEMKVLLGIDFNLIKIKCIIIENNFPDRFKPIENILIANGFQRFAETRLDVIFVQTELLKSI